MDENPPERPAPEPQAESVWIVAEPGYVPPDPDEPPPLELGTATAGVRPWGTLVLVLVWTLVVLALATRHEMGDSAAYLAWGANATGLPHGATAWRLLASTFLHDGIAHLFFNGLTMLVFGPAVERIFGHRGLWPVYAVGGAAASLASVAWRAHQGVPSLSLGASGAIFALGGALLAAAVRLRRRLAPGRARALGAAMLFLVAQSLAGGVTRHGTDNVAHAAGLAAGFLVGLVLPVAPRLGGPERSAPATAIAMLCAAALAVALALAVRGGFGIG